jgi:hypothetical protein
VKINIANKIVGALGVPSLAAAWLLWRFLLSKRGGKGAAGAKPAAGAAKESSSAKAAKRAGPRRDYKVKKHAEDDDEARAEARRAALAALAAQSANGLDDEGDEEDGAEGGEGGAENNAQFINMLKS